MLIVLAATALAADLVLHQADPGVAVARVSADTGRPS